MRGGKNNSPPEELLRLIYFLSPRKAPVMQAYWHVVHNTAFLPIVELAIPADLTIDRRPGAITRRFRHTI
jgi:hypothetical protein